MPVTLSVHKSVEQAEPPSIMDGLAGALSSYKPHNLFHLTSEEMSISHRLMASTTKFRSLDQGGIVR